MVNNDTRADMRRELYEAIYCGDLAAAEAVLEEMQICGIHADEIRRAKRRGRPELRVQMQAVLVEHFPVPRHLPGSMMGIPKLAKASA